MMIDHLAILLEAFPRSANHTRCFTHILNLVAKCIMKQFDAPKKKKEKKAVTTTIRMTMMKMLQIFK